MIRRLPCSAALVLLVFIVAGSTASAQETTVEVTLDSFSIAMPETIPAGPVTLEVTNTSSMPHSITIEGNGVTMTMPETLVPAGPTSTTWEIDLEPGTYTLWCPIGAHRDQGMERTITVEGEASGPAAEPSGETPAAGVDTSYLDDTYAEPESTPAAQASEDESDGTSTGLLLGIGAVVVAIAAVGGGMLYRRSAATK